VSSNDTVLIYAINRTDAWWMHVGSHLGFARSVVVTDVRGAGDIDVVDQFYEAYSAQEREDQALPAELTASELDDVIARCRLLRWLPRRQAQGMVIAMERAFADVLDEVRPAIVVSFPIDRYVSDVLERLARRRGIPYVELTVSLVSGMCMLMHRGQLVKTGPAPDTEILREHVETIASPSFTPVYVKKPSRYSRRLWWAIFVRFRVRGWVFRVISWLKRDPLNLHYLDAQSFLGHKARWNDVSVIDLINWSWRDRLHEFTLERRVFFGLQLFPEASIDYWLASRELIDYEDLMVDAANAFSSAGYLVVVKDHPSQFGFRQKELIERLLAVPNVILVPYEVSGNEVLSLTGVSFTLTGTLGLQAALLGKTSVTTPTYYVTEGDFVLLNSRGELERLPQCIQHIQPCDDVRARQARLLSHLLEGSFEGDFFSFRGFDPRAPSPSAAVLAGRLGDRLRYVLSHRGDVLGLS
jgi:hypothetical protein